MVAISLCVMAACSGGSDNPSGGADDTSSESEATELPEPATQPTVPGAKAFVEHWVATLNDASNSGDTEAWRALAQSDCGACVSMADGIDILYDDGGSLTTDGWQVLNASVALRPAGAKGGQVTGAEVRLRVNRLPEAVYPDADSQAEVFRGGKQSYVVMLVRIDDSWSVRNFARVRRTA